MALSSLQITLPATLDSPFESLTRLCAKHVLPYLSTRKGQVAAISSAVALTVLYLAFDRITRPPRALRYIPHVSYFSFISDMVKRKPFSQIADRNAIPIIKQGHDIYLVIYIYIYIYTALGELQSQQIFLSVWIVLDGRSLWPIH